LFRNRTGRRYVRVFRIRVGVKACRGRGFNYRGVYQKKKRIKRVGRFLIAVALRSLRVLNITIVISFIVFLRRRVTPLVIRA